ncbi:MAG TPA: rhodanese-like domain-containing protein [Gammaproteobacteria bacterium]
MDRYIEFIGNHVELHLALVLIVGFIAWSFLASRLAGYHRIGPSEAVALLNNRDGLLLDVRDTKEFKEGHAVDAVHIPLSALEKRHVELNKHKELPVIVACRSGARSTTACSLLRKQGFQAVYLLSGGMLAWENANLPVTRK